MGSQPLISVCIPCYNNEEFIACTLESVLNQTFEDFELIVSDDKSSDRTLSVVRNYRDPRIRVLENPTNLGIAGNWNKVLSCATGKYVKLLCGDDALYPECLARQTAILEHASNAGVTLATCHRSVIDAEGKVVWRRKFPFKGGRVNGAKLIRKCVRRGANLIGEPAVGLFRREALDPVRRYDPLNPYYIDLGIWAELLRKGDAFVEPEYLAAFRISEKAATTKIGGRHAAWFRAFARAVHEDPFYRISRFDLAAGYALSLQWCLLRNLFINFHLRKVARPGGSAPPAPLLSEKTGAPSATDSGDRGALPARNDSDKGLELALSPGKRKLT